MPAKRASVGKASDRKMARLNKSLSGVMCQVETWKEANEEKLRLERLRIKFEDDPQLAKRIDIAIEQGAFDQGSHEEKEESEFPSDYRTVGRIPEWHLLNYIPSLCGPRITPATLKKPCN